MRAVSSALAAWLITISCLLFDKRNLIPFYESSSVSLSILVWGSSFLGWVVPDFTFWEPKRDAISSICLYSHKFWIVLCLASYAFRERLSTERPLSADQCWYPSFHDTHNAVAFLGSIWFPVFPWINPQENAQCLPMNGPMIELGNNLFEFCHIVRW